MSAAGLFGRATASLQDVSLAPACREDAIDHNVRLWSVVLGALRDPGNALPMTTRTAMISLARTAQWELAKPAPDFGFLIAINDAVVASLAARP